MRKLLLLFTALLTLGASGAWAEVTQPTLTTDVNNPVYYTIGSYNRGGYLTYNGASANLTHVSATKASLWYFIENGEGVSIIPAIDPTVKLATVNSATATGAVWYLIENPYNAGYFCISLTSDLSANCIDANNSGSGTGTWNPRSADFAGTSWTIEEAYNPTLPEGKYISVGAKATSFTAASSASDNDHWYILTQTRDGETPVYDVGLGSNVMRAATTITTTSLDGAAAETNAAFMVRFISAGDGLYNIQFADGNFINSSLITTVVKSQAGTYAFYNTDEGSSTFGWNLNSNTGSIVDNNGAGNTVALWNSGTVTGDKATANNVWTIYPVTFSDATSYLFNTTYGAFFQSLTTNKTAGSSNYCNLWLSKNTAGKPQLKLITNDASANGGNNMRSSGGLYTTASAYTYNLSISEGKIKSYTIVGTAVGALSITPADGSAEEFAASASVNMKVTLDTPAKQTSFTLTTLGDGAQWLDVTKFVIEYESDATTVASLSGITNSGIYTLEPHNAECGVMYAGTTYMDACGGHANTNYPANKATAIDATDPNQQFVLYTYGGNTYLYNVGRAKFAGVADVLYYKLTGAPVNTWTVSAGAYDKYFHLTSGADSKMATINAWTNTGSSDSKNYAVTGQTANEEANNFLIQRVGTLTSEQQTAIETIITNYLTLQTSLATLGEYTVGTGLNQYTNASLADNEAKETAITNVQEGLKDCESSDIPTAKTQVQDIISAMTLNTPATNTFFRIKGYATNKYAKAGSVAATISSATQIPNSVNQETDGSDIWYYDESIHLINYKNGLGTINTHSFATVSQTKETITFAASTCSASGAKKIGVYEVKSNYTGSKVWYSNTNNVDRNTANNHVNCEWVLEAVETLPVTISSAGYATLFSPVALTIPTGVTAYVATEKDESTLLLTSIDDNIIPANVGVVLKGEEGKYEFAVTSDAGTASSVLTGGVATIAKPETAYYLSNGASGIGFYKGGSATTLAGFKAYYAGTGGAVKTFVFDSTDGIDEIADAKAVANTAIYNLAGQRVEKTQRGIYIIGGKKVVVK